MWKAYLNAIQDNAAKPKDDVYLAIIPQLR